MENNTENLSVSLTKDDGVPRRKESTNSPDGAGFMSTGNSGQLPLVNNQHCNPRTETLEERHTNTGSLAEAPGLSQ